MTMQSTALVLLHPALKDASGQDVITWPEIGGFFVFALIIGAVIAAGLDIWKTRRQLGHETALRELVNRYEQLAASTMDAQQRIATDVAELRSRATSIEQILRTVD